MKEQNIYSEKVGNLPGTLLYTGEQKNEPVHIKVMYYNSKDHTEADIKEKDLLKMKERPKNVLWTHIEGLHKTSTIEATGTAYDIPSLVLEDIMDTKQLPKINEQDEFVHVVVKILTYNEKTKRIRAQHTSIVYKDNTIISFQEHPLGIIEHVRERIRKGKGKILHHKADYLLYSIMDSIVDEYFIVLEKLGNELESIEASLLDNPTKKNNIQSIMLLKRNLLTMRRQVWPLRDMIYALRKTDEVSISDDTIAHLNDVLDHISRIIEILESYRDLTLSLFDIHQSNINTSMNNVMKVLTVIATIFIPLTFITGIYGMNFRHMPELDSVWGYPVVLGVMFILAGIMVFIFKKRDWL